MKRWGKLRRNGRNTLGRRANRDRLPRLASIFQLFPFPSVVHSFVYQVQILHNCKYSLVLDLAFRAAVAGSQGLKNAGHHTRECILRFSPTSKCYDQQEQKIWDWLLGNLPRLCDFRLGRILQTYQSNTYFGGVVYDIFRATIQLIIHRLAQLPHLLYQWSLRLTS